MQEIIERYFNISHDASATLIITLITFLLGYLITAIAFLVTRYANRLSNRKIFIENLESLNKSVKAQEEGIIDTIGSLNIVTNTIWEYHKVELFQISVFREMSYKESFKSFFTGIENLCCTCISKKLRRKAFNRTWQNINTLEFWSNKAFQDFYTFLEKYNQHGDKRNEAIAELRKIWESFFEKYGMENPNELHPEIINYLNELNSIIYKYSKIPTNERVGPFVTHRKLVLEIRFLNRRHHEISFNRIFNDKAVEASHHYHEMELLIRNIKGQYKAYYYAFQNIRRTNKKIVEILN